MLTNLVTFRQLASLVYMHPTMRLAKTGACNNGSTATALYLTAGGYGRNEQNLMFSFTKAILLALKSLHNRSTFLAITAAKVFQSSRVPEANFL